MRKMIDLGSGQRVPDLHVIIDTPTSVNCGGGIGVVAQDPRLRRSLRTLVDRMFPTFDADSAHGGGSAVPTSYLAREMQHDHLRIALECDRRRLWPPCSSRLYDVPVWCLYCNGRKVGFAVRRQARAADAAVLKLMRSVSAGAGVLPVGVAGLGVVSHGQSAGELWARAN